MSQKAIVILFLLFSGLCSVESSSKDLYSSMSDMENLFEMEHQIAEKVENFVKLLDVQINSLDSFLDKYYMNHNYTEDDAEEYVSHPLNTFSLIKRTAIDWPILKDKLFGDNIHDHADDILNIFSEFKIKESDMEGSIRGLLLLLDTYQFNLTDFSHGRIQIPKAQRMDMDITEKYIQDNPLSLSDLHNLGLLSYNTFNLVQSVQILQAAEKRAQEENDKHILKMIRSQMKSVMKHHDQLLLRPAREEKYVIREYPFDKELAKKLKKKFPKNKKKGKQYPDLEELANFKELFHDSPIDQTQTRNLFAALCRGENIRTPKMDIKMKCQYLHYLNPYLRLGPFKMETKNHAPFVAIFRDFLTENEIKTYIERASPHLFRSTHGTNKLGREQSSSTSSHLRTSKQFWVKEDLDFLPFSQDDEVIVPLATKVSHRIQNATLMNVFTLNGGEAFQVANYGIAGQYSQHYDAAPERIVGSQFEYMGDRVQTFMAYLTDVEAGGATVFPYLGISVWPKKGDAITWYNVDKTTFLGDYLSLHGGCPVIKGSKWITNKWIRHYPQLFNFPCDSQSETFSRLNPLQNDICKMIPSCKPRFGFGYFTKPNTMM